MAEVVLEKKIKKISVRELIEYTLRSGSITNVFLSSARAVDGIRAHQKFQNQTDESYKKEVPISMEIECDSFVLLLQGRVDGIDFVDGQVLIDEIKSTGGSLKDISGDNKRHWAQVKMYAYMYAIKENIETITLRLTYIELEDFNIKQFQDEYSIEKLKNFFDEVIALYLTWAKKQEKWQQLSSASIKDAEFPFETFRVGQKKLMSSVYKTIEEKKVLFSRAPTGIGKTIATLFPSIKALGNEKVDKIFYLTAKTIGKEVASDTLQLMQNKGLKIKRVIITAKDKICLNDVKSCNEADCPYAKGHYDRVNYVVEEMYDHYDCYNRDLIEEFSKKHQVCPYELTLDLALFSDIIIGDYNYAFDPTTMLKRFFVEGAGKYTLLVDEAHNLVDRAREMHSASIEKQQVLNLKNKIKTLDLRLHRYFNQLNKVLIDYRKVCNEKSGGYFIKKDMPYEIEDILKGIIYRTEKIFKIHKDWQFMDELIDFYFNAYDFIKKSEVYDESYITYYEKREQNNLLLKMFCVDPSNNLKSIINNMQGVVYFSGTLLPLNYYVKILGGDKESYGLNIQSPFSSKNLCLLIENKISTKYIDRENSIDSIIEILSKIISSKKGNYIIYFPSYKYMESIFERYLSCYDHENIELVIQQRGMDEIQKERFIKRFSEDRKHSLLVFAVLGGMFSEGIDLKGEQLCCAIIVGVGLPQISLERNIIKDFFDANYMHGFDYSYVFPGMNKVLQGAGRVIRTADDRGAVILIDSRFNTQHYQRLFPEEWCHYKVIDKDKDITDYLIDFW